MNSFQTTITQSKLEQLRHEAKFFNTLEPIRQQHLRRLYGAIRTLMLEIRILSIGSLEIPGNVGVQQHV